MKWQDKMQEFGLNDSNISAGLRNKIKDFNSILDGIAELKEKIAKPSVNDDVDELKGELLDLQDSVTDAENTLIKAIELYNKNKDVYAKISKNIGRGRPAKDGKPKNKVAAVNTETTPATPVAPVVTPQVQSTDSKPETPKEEKKSSNFFAWALGTVALVILGAVTLGSVRE